MPESNGPTPNDAASAGAGGDGSTASTKADLPEWAQKELTDARSEAARYRTEKNAAVETAVETAKAQFDAQLGAAATAKAEVEKKLTDAILDGQKLRTAIAADLPVKSLDALDQFAKLLQGDDEESLKSHADELKKLFAQGAPDPTPDRPVDRSQGSGVPSTPLNGDQLLNALKKTVGI